MRNMSFALTTEQIKQRTKTVTRWLSPWLLESPTAGGSYEAYSITERELKAMTADSKPLDLNVER